MTEKEFYVWAGKKFRQMREEKSITQDELAEKTGIDRSLISKFENTGKKISAFRLKQLLEALGLSLGDLSDEKKNLYQSPLTVPA